MSEHEQKSLPLKNYGIRLDAESVRAELEEAPAVHGLSVSDAELIARLDDEQINTALRDSADDNFWAVYDDLRSTAIMRLAEQLSIDRSARA